MIVHLKPRSLNRRALSDREAEILRLLMQGVQRASIAGQVGLDETSVREHIKSILRQVHSTRSHRRPGGVVN